MVNDPSTLLQLDIMMSPQFLEALAVPVVGSLVNVVKVGMIEAEAILVLR